MLGSLFALLVSLLLVGITASIGARFQPDGSWYRELCKPSWAPADIAFPIAWGILYLLTDRSTAHLIWLNTSAWRPPGLSAD